MEIIEFGNKQAQIVLIQMVDEHDLEFIENEAAYITNNADVSFRLIAAKVENWNYDLSPWEASAVFGKEGFGGGANRTLKRVLDLCRDDSKIYYIGGYSLAGLFALWAASKTDVFKGVAAASPSVWFPGFSDYIRNNQIKCDSVYLSLGNKEEKTRNSVMAAVGNKIREIYNCLQEQKKNCILEWNEGNHFVDADIRTAKAFCRVLKQK